MSLRETVGLRVGPEVGKPQWPRVADQQPQDAVAMRPVIDLADLSRVRLS
jgi:hypothetical protein